MKSRVRLLALFILSFPGAALLADVALAPLFRDHAVLQRDKPIPVWGRADAGEQVTVTFAGKSGSTRAAGDGRWQVELAPLPARPEGASLVVTGKNTVTIKDVVVGEVWLASGQSNMAWELRNTDDAGTVIAAAELPLIRQFRVSNAVASEPADQAGGAWTVAHPRTVGGFSAVGFYFAKAVHEELNVPVGIINSSWGGTPIVAWMSADALASDPAFAVVGERWTKILADYPQKKDAWDKAMIEWKTQKEGAASQGAPFTKVAPREPAGPGQRFTPTGLYNAMIHPLEPYALRGAIWYQGEHDSGRADEYAKWFPALIKDWRRTFAQGDFPFYWVQLPNYGSGNPQHTGWASLREAQSGTLALPATGQAVTIDIGNPADIHPRNKRDVGHRLALLAFSRTYGRKDTVDSGPVFAGVDFRSATARVRFTEAHGGLKSSATPLLGFELAGDDQVFKPAEARIEGDAVLVTSTEVSSPVAVRYAWRNAPPASLYNGAGLPAVPFRSDAW